MHEISIVNSIIKTLEIEFEREKLDKLKAIYLKVGILSNIEPMLLKSAFEAYNHEGSKYKGVTLYIVSMEIKIQCEKCNHITQVKKYRFICEKCNQPSKAIIQGEEMLIHKVEFEDG